MITKTQTDPQVGDADPVFKIVTDREPIYQSGERGLITSSGTKVFVFGKQLPHVSAIKYEVTYGGLDAVPETTITIKLAGSQVETEFTSTAPKFVALNEARK